ncbi:MAG: leucine-rich repeat protein [Oscillospiraceae bacterium]|nr:leucine-rich repeat protein [Oscillospiraceae bacterium]MBQ3500116.1 leucine-rich repeat protein [Oscillospiraceae bacterium]
MSNVNDFVIENGVLKKYNGKDKNVVIPEGVREIGENAFSRKHIKTVSMPDSVEVIGWNAFESCRYLEKVSFSDNLKEILPNAFGNCQALESVSLPNSLKKIDICAFSGCFNIKELILPEHDFEIGESAFSGCESLADENGYVIVRDVLYNYTKNDSDKIQIAQGVKHINRTLLWNNYTIIHSLHIPASVETIQDKTFETCTNLRECFFAFTVKDSKQAELIIKKAFSLEGLAYAFLSGTFLADPLIIDALKKQIASKSFRVSFLRRMIYCNNAEAIKKLLECTKKLPLNELDEYIDLSDDPSVRTVFMEYKNR